jgi:hypothetical protein
MYKKQFKIWGWRKYQKIGRGCVRTARTVPLKTEPIKMNPSCNEKLSHYKSAVLAAIQQFVLGSAQHSRAWKATSKFQLLHNQRSIVNGFHASLDALDHESNLGWQMIKRAFILIEEIIEDGSISSFLNLCFYISRSLLFSNHKKILDSYLRHLDLLAAQKRDGSPLRQIASSLRPTLEKHGYSEIHDLLVFASKAWADTLTQTRNLPDRSTLHAVWDSIRLSGTARQHVVLDWLSNWEQLYMESIFTCGKHSPSTIFLEDDLSHLLDSTRIYADEEMGGAQNAVDQMRRKHFLLPIHGGLNVEGCDDFFRI